MAGYERIEMKNNPRSLIFAFLMGVILLWSFGKDWLHLESALVFLAALIGVALPVILFGVWNIHRSSKDN
jgi:biotin transporter BioY